MDVPIRRGVPQIVTSERYLSLLLGFLGLAVFVLPALGFEGSDERLYADIMFTLTSPGVFHVLRRTRRWGQQRYQDWVITTATQQLLIDG